MAQILDQYGNPIERVVLDEPQTARLGWMTQQFAEHPSRGLTPARLHRILEDAERGDLASQADLFVDMEEKDGHIFAEMSKRKRILLTRDWSIEPPANASAAEKAQAAQIQEWLKELNGFEDVVLDALDAIGHGFSAQEIEWHKVGKAWLPKSLTHRPQRWFQTLPTDGNALRLRNSTMFGTELLPFGWVVHRHKAKSGYLTRSGLHRVLVWPYLFKNYSVRDLAEFLEIYGLPLRVGKYPPGASKEEKATLLAAVAGIGHNAAGIIPDSMLIEFQNAAQGSHEPFFSQTDWCERTQSKAILGGTLTSQADGKTSTHALGNVHNEVRHDLMESDGHQLERTFDRDLIYPLVALNFGDCDPSRMPHFKYDLKEAGDLRIYSVALPSLVNMGMEIPTDWAHDKLAIPKPKDGQKILQPSQPPQQGADGADMFAANSVTHSATHTRRYRAALTSETGVRLYADQVAIDEANLAAEAMTQGMDKVLAPAIAALKQGGSPEEAIEALARAYPDMDDTELSESLARAIFVADIWGRINAQT